MREKPLSKIGEELLRLRHGLSRTSEHRSPAPGFGIDGELAAGFVDDALSPQQQVQLAQQVAGMLPFHWSQSNTYASVMSQILEHVGSQQKLMRWLDGFPGLPRLTARLYVVMGLLDEYSGKPAVVTALREFREQTPVPPGLQGCLLPETDDETLAGLAFRIEEHLGDQEMDKAVEIALATTDCLRRVAPRATELDPSVDDMGELMSHSQHDLQDAAAEAGA
ncbi:hypothetical protein [Streptomyces adustus]|uniref:hypothetical protein n=1 Tax=Streptomyces adustus TaxID=1609272 RepID=UPI0037202D5C